MTEPLEPLSDPDELASALLDGALDAAEARRAAADPAVLARSEQFRAVSRAVAEPVPILAEEERSRLRAAALAAADVDPAEPMIPLAPAVQLAGRRRRKAQRTWLPHPAVAAAVVIVIALVGIGLIVSGDGGSDENASRGSADLESAATVLAPDATRGAPATSTTGPGTTGPADGPVGADGRVDAVAVPDLGSFASTEDLGEVLEDVELTTLAAAETTTTLTAEPPAPASQTFRRAEVDRCSNAIRAAYDQDLGAPLAVAVARVAERDVFVYSHPRTMPAPDGSSVTLLTVADVVSCEVRLAMQR